eukprot:358348_1
MSKKRRLEFNDESTNAPPNKKQNIDSISSTISSRSFSNQEDQKQFQSIYQAVNDSNIVRQYFIPSIVLIQISEYATGNIVKCDNYAQCQHEILVLNEDNDWIGNSFKIETSKKYFSNQFKIFCSYDENSDSDNDSIHQQIFCEQCSKTKQQCSETSRKWSHSDRYDDYFDERQCQKYFIAIKCKCGQTIDKCDTHRSYCVCNFPTCEYDSGYGDCLYRSCSAHKRSKCNCEYEKDICSLQITTKKCRYDSDTYVCGDCVENMCECGDESCFRHKGSCNGFVICECKDECGEVIPNPKYVRCKMDKIKSKFICCIKCCDDISSRKLYCIHPDHVDTFNPFKCSHCKKWCGHMICSKCQVDQSKEFLPYLWQCNECRRKCIHSIQ